MKFKFNKTGRRVGQHALKVNQSGKITQIGNQVQAKLGPIKPPKLKQLKVPKVKSFKL